jgi:hypothetical protein
MCRALHEGQAREEGPEIGKAAIRRSRTEGGSISALEVGEEGMDRRLVGDEGNDAHLAPAQRSAGAKSRRCAPRAPPTDSEPANARGRATDGRRWPWAGARLADEPVRRPLRAAVRRALHEGLPRPCREADQNRDEGYRLAKPRPARVPRRFDLSFGPTARPRKPARSVGLRQEPEFEVGGQGAMQLRGAHHRIRRASSRTRRHVPP